MLTGYDSYFSGGGTREGLRDPFCGKFKFTDKDLCSLASCWRKLSRTGLFFAIERHLPGCRFTGAYLIAQQIDRVADTAFGAQRFTSKRSLRINASISSRSARLKSPGMLCFRQAAASPKCRLSASAMPSRKPCITPAEKASPAPI